MKKNSLIVQDNRLTTARYELSLLEKRIYYLVIDKIRQEFILKNEGNKTLFEDLIVTFTASTLKKNTSTKNKKEIKKALKTLRLRSFEWDNGKSEEDPEHEYLEIGFIDWQSWKNDQITFQVSRKLVPFLVELSKNFTSYSLLIAMSLKSKWSQRLYEMASQWKAAGGFYITIEELRNRFMLENRYKKYGALKERVLEVAKNELKALFDRNEIDFYFEYSEEKNGRSVRGLNFKIISNKNINRLSLHDLDYFVRMELAHIFQTKQKQKNEEFVKEVMKELRLKPELLEKFYKRLLEIKQNIPKSDIARYLRYVINEDYLKKGKENN